MSTWFVSRHRRAHFWLRTQIARGRIDLAVDHWVTHIDVTRLERGDLVVGTLPFADVVALQQRGARFIALTMDLPEEVRGRELSATEMAAYNARLLEVRVDLVADTPVAADAQPVPETWGDGSEARIAFVSEQLAPLYLAAKQYAGRIRELCLLASERMQGKARQLKATLERFEIGPDSITVVKLGDAGDDHERLLAAARKQLAALRARHPEACLVADLTTGTKPMALALSQASAELRAIGVPARSFYTNTDQLQFQWLAPPASAEPMQARLTLDEALALQGRVLVSSGSTGEAGRRAELTKALYAALDEDRLSLLNGTMAPVLNAMRQRPKSRWLSIDEEGSSRLSCLRKPLNLAQKLGLIRFGEPMSEGAPPPIQIRDQEAAKYLCGGWFEEWVWLQLKDIGLETLALNVEIGDAADPSVCNEFDLIALHANRLLTIEAKTALLDGVSVTTDANRALHALQAKTHALAQVHGSRLLVSSRSLRDETLSRALRDKVSVLCRSGRYSAHNVLEPERVGEVVRRWMQTGQLADRSGKPTPQVQAR